MKITIVPTSEMTEMDSHPVRLWKGQTESGIPVVLAVHRVIVNETDRQEEFRRDLVETVPPDEDRKRAFPVALQSAISMRMVM